LLIILDLIVDNYPKKLDFNGKPTTRVPGTDPGFWVIELGRFSCTSSAESHHAHVVNLEG
jgi:hypothetical protein